MYRLIPRDLKAPFFWLIAVSVLGGILEVAGVASIMPFVALMSDPTIIQNSMVGKILPLGYAIPPIHFVGLGVLILYVLTNLLNLMIFWLSVRFSSLLGVRLSEDLAESYFSKGYMYLSSQSPALLANNITRETEKIATCGVLQLCILTGKLIQIVMIVGLLLFVSPRFMTVFSIVLLMLYSFSYRLTSKRLTQAGSDAADATAQAVQEAHEMFFAAKELLLRGSVPFFINGVRSSIDRYFKSDAVGRVLPVVPKYVIELIAFSALLLIPIYRSWIGEDYRDFLPVMALFAFAGYRILPGVQQAYSSFSILKFQDALATRFMGVLDTRSLPVNSNNTTIAGLKKDICLEHVSFNYPGNNTSALADVSLTINRGHKIAIIGPSGAGKSTLLDILLGLLAPTHGTLKVDDLNVGIYAIPWDKRAIGYVPQSPLILRTTVAKNIAFGLPDEEIDRQRCKAVAEFACINEVIEGLPDGIDTLLDDGVSLSGGEIQRLAIARALYFSPSILVLDEPTSALDPMISSRLIANLCSSNFESTVVVVTHDWDTLASFDQIVLIDQGRVVAAGNYSAVSKQVEFIRTKVDGALEFGSQKSKSAHGFVQTDAH